MPKEPIPPSQTDSDSYRDEIIEQSAKIEREVEEYLESTPSINILITEPELVKLLRACTKANSTTENDLACFLLRDALGRVDPKTLVIPELTPKRKRGKGSRAKS